MAPFDRAAGRSSPVVIAILGLSIPFGACSTTGSGLVDVEGDDDTLFLGLRVQHAFERDTDQTDGIRISIEGVLERGDGEFTQQLRAGEAVRLDDVRVDGPADVEVDFDLVRTYVALRGARRLESGVVLSGFAGFSSSDLEIRARSGGVPDDENIFGLGLIVGLGAAAELTSILGAFAEISLSPQIAGARDGLSLTTIDMGLSVRLMDGLEIATGWRRWALDVDTDEDDGFLFASPESDLDLELSGVFLSLWLGI